MTRAARRGPMDHVRSLRERIRSQRATRLVYRIVISLLGGALTLVGLALVPLPGPGWLVVLAGLAVLASEFEPAERLLRFTLRRLRAWTVWLGRQGGTVRVGVALTAVLCVGAACYGTVVVLGVPAWVPDALVARLPWLTP